MKNGNERYFQIFAVVPTDVVLNKEAAPLFMTVKTDFCDSFSWVDSSAGCMWARSLYFVVRRWCTLKCSFVNRSIHLSYSVFARLRRYLLFLKVPFSRAGIYNYPDLDAVDKRKVMKFMQLCVEDSAAHQKEIEKTNDLSVGDYLKQKKVPSMTRASIINAIALCSDSTPLVKVCLELVRP